MTVPISEIFDSFSGEAPTVGVYATFVRFGQCNMAKLTGSFCEWCDTPYALTIKGKDIFDRSIEDIAEKISKSNTNLVVFTGGEPAIWASEIDKIVKKIEWPRCYELNYQIETNGSLSFGENLEFLDYLVISPKLPPSVKKRYPIKVLESAVINNNCDLTTIWKFVWESKESEKQILDTLEKCYVTFKNRVWIMPQGTTFDEILANSKIVFEFCKKHGFNFSPRMQIEYWGNRRGV